MKGQHDTMPIPDKLKQIPVWCVSKDKCPLDMYALQAGLEWGVSPRRSHSCHTDWQTAADMSKKKGYPVTLYVDPARLGVCVLDIEKTCPAEIRQKLLLSLHGCCLCLERSMSGKGYHMLLKLEQPRELHTGKYRKDFELLACHHCVMTGQEISFQTAWNDSFPENRTFDEEEDRELLELIARPATADRLAEFLGCTGAAAVPAESEPFEVYRRAAAGFDGRHADLFSLLCNVTYAKDPDRDFSGDMSRYEFGYAAMLHSRLKKITACMTAEDLSQYSLEMSPEEAIAMVWMVTRHNLPPRPKHSQTRNGLPWLLYNSERVYRVREREKKTKA